MSKSKHERMYEEYKLYFPTHARDTVKYRPCGTHAIVVTLNNNTEYIYDSLNNSLFYDRTRLADETDAEYVKRKIHNRLSFFMDNRRCGQDKLCELTGITQATISRYLTGKSIPSVLNLYKIASALDCKIEDIIN